MASLLEAARRVGVSVRRETDPVQREIDTGELTLRYLDWGDEEAPPLVLLHGFAQTAHSWDLISLSLCDRYRVIALDARGHGDSDWSPAHDYSLDAHLRDVERVVRHLECDSVGIVGLSMGGRTAYTFAAKHPDLTAALVIVDSGPALSGTGRIRHFASLPDELGSYEAFVRRVHDYQPRRSLEQIRETLRFNVRQLSSGKWTWKYDRVLRDPEFRRSVASEEEGWADLGRLATPALLVRGAESDVLTSEAARRMTWAIPNCSFAEVPAAGHIVPGDNPAGFIAALEPWLETTMRSFA